MSIWNWEKNALIRELYELDHFLLLVREIIEYKEYTEFSVASSKWDEIELLDEIEEKRDELQKEVVQYYKYMSYNPPISYFLAFVDAKGVMRYRISLSFEDKLTLGGISKCFEPKRVITNEELIKKGKLEAKNFIISKRQSPKVYYEDNEEAFELTSKSIFPNEESYSLIADVDSITKILIFNYKYDVDLHRGRINECTTTGKLNLSTLEVFDVQTKVERHPS